MIKALIHELSLSFYGVILIPMILFSIIFYLLALYGIFSGKDKKQRRFSVKGEQLPFVTIQIPTRNEPVALRCAERCLRFDYPKDRFEIIIGDDSDNPEVSRMIDRFAAKHPQIRVTRRGSNKGFKAGNLNYMLKYSKGDIIVVFDSD
ncbi:MAG TPA: glycosyltransferase, partial [Candidatus Aenigmarchaeota archaeon]|nr:glycosyltransferase [Candidatus Aenigmarchaeota archaeon]